MDNWSSPRLYSVAFVLLALASCSPTQREYKLAAGSPHSSMGSVGEEIANLVSGTQTVRLKAEVGEEVTGNHNIDRLLRKDVDFAIVQNDSHIDHQPGVADHSDNIRTIAPLFSEILFIIYKDSLHPENLADLVRGRRISVGPRTSATAQLIPKLFRAYGIDSADYEMVFSPYEERTLSDSAAICCALTGYTNPSIAAMLNSGHGRLFSLDSVALAGRGSSVDGFCLAYSAARSTILPKNVFGKYPEAPILSLAIDVLLVTRADVDPEVVREVTASLFGERNLLAERVPLLQGMNERFDPGLVRYPVHEGAEMYYQRNQPSFFERHSNLIEIAFSFLVAAVGAVSWAVQWSSRRKKNRIDQFYVRVGDLERTIPELATSASRIEAIEKIAAIKREAFDLLVQEKLSADEGFRIFISLADATIGSIRELP